ncbi:MAG: acetolactate synthase small subunit [Candidatus Hydrothermarchaeales archaeon]
MTEKHVLVVLVEDKPGVMMRITGLFTRRHFNIETISVGHTEKEGISRITLTVLGDKREIEQVMKQLNKVVEVLKVSRMDSDSIMRELALVKINTKDKDSKAELIQLVDIFRGRIVDVTKESMVVEITGDGSKVDAFVSMVTSFGIKELAITGVTAMSRGPKATEAK